MFHSMRTVVRSVTQSKRQHSAEQLNIITWKMRSRNKAVHSRTCAPHKSYIRVRCMLLRVVYVYDASGAIALGHIVEPPGVVLFTAIAHWETTEEEKKKTNRKLSSLVRHLIYSWNVKSTTPLPQSKCQPKWNGRQWKRERREKNRKVCIRWKIILQ